MKRKLQEYNVRLDDYVPPDDINPIVLKLDKNGNEVDIDNAMNKINQRLKEIEALHAKESPMIEKNKDLQTPKVLVDPKAVDQKDSEKKK